MKGNRVNSRMDEGQRLKAKDRRKNPNSATSQGIIGKILAVREDAKGFSYKGSILSLMTNCPKRQGPIKV